jgi:hypothetical protein
MEAVRAIPGFADPPKPILKAGVGAGAADGRIEMEIGAWGSSGGGGVGSRGGSGTGLGSRTGRGEGCDEIDG